MQTKWKKIFSFALAAVVAVSAVPTTEMRVQAQEEENLADLEYEIYPIPREISYDQDSGTMEPKIPFKLYTCLRCQPI